jgi:hypothetical protein
VCQLVLSPAISRLEERIKTGEGQILFDEDKPPALKALEAKKAEVKEVQAKVTGLNAAGSSAIQAETQLAKAEEELEEVQKLWDLVKLPPNNKRIRQLKGMLKTMCANIQHSSIATGTKTLTTHCFHLQEDAMRAHAGGLPLSETLLRRAAAGPVRRVGWRGG